VNIGFRFFEGVCGFMLGEWEFNTLANVLNN